MTKAIELSQLGSNLHVGTDDQINFLSPLDTSNVRIAADFDGSGNKNVYLRVAARENRRAALVFESVDGSNVSTTRWSLGRGDSDELSADSFYIGTGQSGGGSSTTKFAITSTGNVGIGITNPSCAFDLKFDTQAGNRHFFAEGAEGVKLQRRADTTNWAMAYGFKSNNNTDVGGFGALGTNTGLTRYWIGPGYLSTLVDVLSNGNVGIGTNNPSGKFQVGTAANNGSHVIITPNTGIDINDGAVNIYQATTNASATPFIISSDIGTGTENEKIRITADGMITGGSNGATGGSTIIQNRYSSPHILNILGSMYSSGATALTYGLRPKAGNSGFESSFSNFSGGRVAAVLSTSGLFVQTAASQNTAVGNTVSVTTKVEVDLSGNVGIGTDPASKLHVNGTVQVGTLADDTHEIKISTNALQFNRTSTSYVDQKGTGDIRFRYGSNYDTWMHLEGSNANIGIGTDVPQSKLHVHKPTGLAEIRLSGTAAGQVEYDIRQGIIGVNNAGFSIRDITNSATRFVISHTGNVGIGTGSPSSKLQVGSGRPVFINDGSIAIRGDAGGWAFGYTIQGNGGTDRGGFGGYGSYNSLNYLWIGDSYNSPTMVVQGASGKVGIGVNSPTAKLHVQDTSTALRLYNTTSIGKTTYASASTGNSQSVPAPTIRWANPIPQATTGGRGYQAWVQSGDAYPNSSNYFQLLIKNSGFYRITLKRSHSSTNASVAIMTVYGLANSAGNNLPVVHISGASGNGSGTSTVDSGHGYGSSNAVASFYWTQHAYNINTHDTIIRIYTNSSNNQGILALVEKI